MNGPNKRYLNNIVIDEETGKQIDITDKLAEDYYQRTGTGEFDGEGEGDDPYYDGLGREQCRREQR